MNVVMKALKIRKHIFFKRGLFHAAVHTKDHRMTIMRQKEASYIEVGGKDLKHSLDIS